MHCERRGARARAASSKASRFQARYPIDARVRAILFKVRTRAYACLACFRMHRLDYGDAHDARIFAREAGGSDARWGTLARPTGSDVDMDDDDDDDEEGLAGPLCERKKHTAGGVI